MAGRSSAMFGWSWTKVSGFGSQLFGQACMCAVVHRSRLFQIPKKHQKFMIVSKDMAIFTEYVDIAHCIRKRLRAACEAGLFLICWTIFTLFE